jgi:hypothetical protein
MEGWQTFAKGLTGQRLDDQTILAEKWPQGGLFKSAWDWKAALHLEPLQEIASCAPPPAKSILEPAIF